MDFKHAIARLQEFQIDEQIKVAAHQEIAPFRATSITETQILNAKKAAVLLLIHPHSEKAHFTLIERSSYEGIHSSQIALPGGKIENIDTNITATALREAQEEVNIHPSDVEIIGNLSEIYIPPSNFYITPVLGISRKRPSYLAQEREVNSILEVPLTELISPSVLKKTQVKIKGNSINTPYLELQGKIVWGATAMILNELRRFFI
jgi:8-oxo-dGTP pyrophosphatase MutT (NUDIX family)